MRLRTWRKFPKLPVSPDSKGAREGSYRCGHGLNSSFPISLSPQTLKGPGRGQGGAGEGLGRARGRAEAGKARETGEEGRLGRLERLMFL